MSNRSGTPNDGFGALAEPTTLVFERWLPGPLDRVWKYLVDSEHRRKWLAAGDMTLTAGAPLHLTWRNDELSASSTKRPAEFPEEQSMQSRVIAVEPMTLLTIAWGEGDVTFELREQGDKVHLKLTHRGLDDRPSRAVIAAGWHAHLDILNASLSRADAASFWSHWIALRALYEARLPS